MRMLSFIRSNVKCLPIKVTLSFFQKRFAQEASDYYSQKFPVKRNAGNTSNINVLFKKLEKNASMGRMFLEDVEQALAGITRTRSLSLDHSLMLLRYCGTLLFEEKPATRIKLVQKIWTTLEELGIPININHYNILLMVYVENKFDISLTDFLNILNKKNIEPNRVTFELIIQKYCQLGEIAAALDTLRIMREKHMPLSHKICHALIDGYATIKDMKNAEAVLSILDQAGIKPSSETYCHLICGYIKQGNLQKLDELLLYCDQQSIKFTDTDCFNIIHSLAVNNFDHEIDKIIPRIEKSRHYFWKAANFTLQLATIGKPEVALKIYNTMNMVKDVFHKNFRFEEFFLVHLIRCDASPDLIIKYCTNLTNTNMNPLILAMEYSLRSGKTDITLMLFKKAKRKNIPIRLHYFWPLLVNEGKKNAVDVFHILSAMQKDFGLTANPQTICQYVVPHFLKQNVDIESHLTAFKSCGVSVGTVISSTVYQLLSRKEMKKAAEIAEKFHANYLPHLFQQPLIMSFLNTGDVRSFTKLLKEISTGLIQNSNEIDLDENESSVTRQKFVSDVLKKTVAGLVQKEDSKELLENLFLHLLEDRVGITKKSAEEIQNILRDNTKNYKSMVQQLVTEEYSQTISKPKSSTIPITSLDLETLESLHESMESDGECTHEIKKYLLPLYARNKEFHKLFKLVEELEANNVILSEGMYAYLIDAYVENNKLDKALGIYRIMCNASNFHLDTVKVLKFALLLLQNGYYDEAFALMNKKVHSNYNLKTDVNEPLLLCKKILEFFADKGNVYHIQHFFNLIVSRKLVPLNNKLLGPLIKVHLQRKDVESAVKEFDLISRKYNATPLKHVLMMKCIEQENWDNLEKIKNISSAIHGDARSLYDLLIAFVESENIEEAKKILKSFVLHSTSEGQCRLMQACDKHLNDGNVKFLQTLLELTKEFSVINREELYFKILCFYNRSGDAHKAMELWTQLQEEGFFPSNEFLILLADILNRKGMPVPFNVPQRCEIKNKNFYRTDDQSVKVSLKTLITAGNIDEAVKLSKTFKPGVMNVRDWSQLIGACLYNGRYLEAKNLFMEFSFLIREMENYHLISHLLNEAVEARDVDFLDYCKLFFSDFWKKKTSFYNHLARFYLKTRGVKDYLKELENAFDSAKTDFEFRRFLSTFPQSGLIDILIAEPEHYQTIESLIRKCTEKGDEAGIGQTVLWIYFMIEKKYNEADAIWKMHFQDKNNIVIFKKLLVHINKNSDLELCIKLMNVLESKKNLSAASLGIVYGIMISLYIKKNSIEEALRILERASKKITIDNIIISSLYTLKAVCKAKNVSFPYNIPHQRHETSSKEDD